MDINRKDLSVTLIGMDFPQSWADILSSSLKTDMAMFASRLSYISMLDRSGLALLESLSILHDDLCRVVSNSSISIQPASIGTSIVYLDIPISNDIPSLKFSAFLGAREVAADDSLFKIPAIPASKSFLLPDGSFDKSLSPQSSVNAAFCVSLSPVVHICRGSGISIKELGIEEDAEHLVISDLVVSFILPSQRL